MAKANSYACGYDLDVQVPDGVLHCRVDDFTDPWSSPDTVLLHHAAMGSSERWRRWIPLLARRYRVVRFDMRGHGFSSLPPPGYVWSIDRLAQDAHDVVKALNLTRVHFVGASAGGVIGLYFAHRYPAIIRSLTLVASTPCLSHSAVNFDEWRERIERLGVQRFLVSDAIERFSSAASPGLIEWFAGTATHMPAWVAASLVPYLATVDLTDHLSGLDIPVLLLAAEFDRITPIDVQHDLMAALKSARLVTYPTRAHNIVEELSERCAQDTLAFLATI